MKWNKKKINFNITHDQQKLLQYAQLINAKNIYINRQKNKITNTDSAWGKAVTVIIAQSTVTVN